MKSIKVAHLAISLDSGGLEAIVLDLIREGRVLGQAVDVICIERSGALARKAEEWGGRVFCVGKPPGVRPAAVRAVARLLARSRPAVVHTHQVGALLYAGPAAKWAGVPLVIHTQHGKNLGETRRGRWLGRFAATFARRFCCVSEDIAAQVVADGVVPRRKVIVVRNGIDVERFSARPDAEAARRSLGIPPDAPIIGTVGRLNEVKRQDRLIRAFAQLLGRVPDAHLLLVGDGPMKGDLVALSEGLGVASRVHFAGYQAQPELFLGMMNVFALTSRSEGMPLAVLEAWAAGVPVVASRVGGLPEMIDDGRTGLLFDTDDENALALAIGRLLADPGRALAIGAAGRDRARDHFDVRVMAASYDRLYRE